MLQVVLVVVVTLELSVDAPLIEYSYPPPTATTIMAATMVMLSQCLRKGEPRCLARRLALFDNRQWASSRG